MTLWLFTSLGPKIKIYDRDLGVVLLLSPFAVLFLIYFFGAISKMTLQFNIIMD